MNFEKHPSENEMAEGHFKIAKNALGEARELMQKIRDGQKFQAHPNVSFRDLFYATDSKLSESLNNLGHAEDFGGVEESKISELKAELLALKKELNNLS